MSRQRSPGGAPSALTSASFAANRAAYAVAASERPSQVATSVGVYTRSRNRNPLGPSSTRASLSTEQTSIPRPRTAMSVAPHQPQHVPHGPVHAHQHRPGHDRMPDVQLVDLVDPGDCLDVVVVEAVPGGNPQPQLAPGACRVHATHQLPVPLLGVPGLTVAAGVELDPVRSELV